MTLDELKFQVEKDLKVNDERLDTESYKKIVEHIHKRKSVSKKELLEHMGWGVRISFSEYRNRLRMEDTIKFTKNRYEVI